MRFWDASAIVPLLVSEDRTPDVMALLRSDPAQVVWWNTRIECVSALAKASRTRGITTLEEAQARVRLQVLSGAWGELLPTNWVRALAELLIDIHGLKASDATQLAVALAWCSLRPQGHEFVCLDKRLRTAATAQGFTVLPETDEVQ